MGYPGGHPCSALSPPRPSSPHPPAPTERVAAATSPRGGSRDPLRDVTLPPGTGVSPATTDAADATDAAYAADTTDAAGKDVSARVGGVRDHVRRTPGSGAGRARARGRRGG